MPKNIDNFKKDLEGFLRSNGIDKLSLLDIDGSSIIDPAEAEQFKFRFKHGSYDYGTVTITVLDREISIFYNQNVVKDLTHGVNTGWTDFLKKLKDWALRNGQMGFKVNNLDKLNFELKKRKTQINQEQLQEGYYGSRNTSYTDSVPKNIKMIIKHSKSLAETDKRYRYIDKIFLETELGERLLLNTKKPSIGRVYARHIAEGGEYNDERWKHISELANDITKLSGFVRATRTKQFNESASNIVEQVVQHFINLKETIKKLQGQRGYNNYFENWKPAIIENDLATEGISKLFKTESLDHRIEAALPILNKLNIKYYDMVEATEFENWANNILENITPIESNKIEKMVKLLISKDEISVGADAMNIKGQLEDIIDDDKHRDSLFKELDAAAEVDPDNDSKPIIVSWLQKHKNEHFYGDVLDKYESGDDVKLSKVDPKPEIPKKSTTNQNSAELTPKMNFDQSDKKTLQSLMPEPIKENSEIDLLKMLSGLKS